MVKALEKTNTKGSGFPHFVKKYQSVKVKPLLERWQTCLITPAKRFVKVNQLGHWSFLGNRVLSEHTFQFVFFWLKVIYNFRDFTKPFFFFRTAGM